MRKDGVLTINEDSEELCSAGAADKCPENHLLGIWF